MKGEAGPDGAAPEAKKEVWLQKNPYFVWDSYYHPKCVGIHIIILDTVILDIFFLVCLCFFFSHLGSLDFVEYWGESSLPGLCGWRWLLMLLTFLSVKKSSRANSRSAYSFPFFCRVTPPQN